MMGQGYQLTQIYVATWCHYNDFFYNELKKMYSDDGVQHNIYFREN